MVKALAEAARKKREKIFMVEVGLSVDYWYESSKILGMNRKEYYD